MLVARIGSVGKTVLFDGEEQAVFASYLIRIYLDKEKINAQYYWSFARSKYYWDQVSKLTSGTVQPQFNVPALREIIVPVPSLDTQEKIIKKIEVEEQLIKVNQLIVNIMQQKTNDILESVFSKSS